MGSSLLYVDADARMDTYTDGEGNKRSNLSLIASEYTIDRRLFRAVTDTLKGTSTSSPVRESTKASRPTRRALSRKLPTHKRSVAST